MTTETTVATSDKAKRPATVYKDVTMDDGRIVQFAGKRKMIKESGKGEGGGLFVRLNFVNGEVRTFPIPEQDIWQYACHGAEQKYGDETAGEDDVDDMIVAVDALAERLAKHEWKITREAGEGFSGASVIIKAMCKVTGKSIDFVKDYLEKKLESTNAPYLAEGKKAVLSRQGLYKSIRASEKFGPTIAEMEAAKAKKGPELAYDDLE